MFWSEFQAVPSVGARVELGGSEGKHAASVRRMRVGEAIQLTNGHGLRVRGAVVEVLPKSLVVQVQEVTHDELPKNKIVLIQALAKGDRDELAVQAATELGAMGVIPWQAERSISRWDEAKAAKGQARWQLICDEAAKQSLRTHFPIVEPAMTTESLLKSFSRFENVLILDPTASQGIGAIALPASSVAIVVGPEGGIADAELDQFEAAGAVRVHLGASILRTSTAGVVAIAAIQALTGVYN